MIVGSFQDSPISEPEMATERTNNLLVERLMRENAHRKEELTRLNMLLVNVQQRRSLLETDLHEVNERVKTSEQLCNDVEQIAERYRTIVESHNKVVMALCNANTSTPLPLNASFSSFNISLPLTESMHIPLPNITQQSMINPNSQPFTQFFGSARSAGTQQTSDILSCDTIALTDSVFDNWLYEPNMLEALVSDQEVLTTVNRVDNECQVNLAASNGATHCLNTDQSSQPSTPLSCQLQQSIRRSASEPLPVGCTSASNRRRMLMKRLRSLLKRTPKRMLQRRKRRAAHRPLFRYSAITDVSPAPFTNDAETPFASVPLSATQVHQELTVQVSTNPVSQCATLHSLSSGFCGNTGGADACNPESLNSPLVVACSSDRNTKDYQQDAQMDSSSAQVVSHSPVTSHVQSKNVAKSQTHVQPASHERSNVSEHKGFCSPTVRLAFLTASRSADETNKESDAHFANGGHSGAINKKRVLPEGTIVIAKYHGKLEPAMVVGATPSRQWYTDSLCDRHYHLCFCFSPRVSRAWVSSTQITPFEADNDEVGSEENNKTDFNLAKEALSLSLSERLAIFGS